MEFFPKHKTNTYKKFLCAGYDYSYAGLTIHLKRNKLGLLIGSFYVPTGIFAMLSMISFAINPEMVPGRLGLLVTLYLIVSNVYGAVKAPSKRGFSYIEIWMTGIQVTIIMAILEYGLVLVLLKYYDTARKITQRRIFVKINAEDK